ncbi:hypothetical protein [Amphibacillus cookii]|uniref:hypothetical protein n=1 Tax=Amphibacillus cookii TaxID=767787 RepID=UPI00195C7040|nr:hypothetical protein [Amphibacillus cookii]MBM7542536.1 beta-lactamase superfamily II metal-dependent hydrolase [Amphibacillus cookii]
MKVGWLFGLLLITISILVSFSNQSEVVVYFLDLPDGEATLVQGTNQQYTLINTGSKASEIYLIKFLETLEIDTIKHLIITDNDQSYCANKDLIINKFDVKHVFDISETMNQHRTKLATPTLSKEPTSIHLDAGLTFHVLAVSNQPRSSTNVLTYNNQAILFMGRTSITDDDIENFNKYDFQIVKTAHFGATFLPARHILTKINPDVAIFFTSSQNETDGQLLYYLEERWIEPYFLEDVGSLIAIFKDSDYDIEVQFRTKNMKHHINFD